MLREASQNSVLELDMENVAENLERVRGRIAETAGKAGRAVDDIELVAISKTHEAEKVRASQRKFVLAIRKAAADLSPTSPAAQTN